MIPVDLSQTVMVGSMIRTDPGSRSLGSDPGIHFRDPRTCLSGAVTKNGPIVWLTVNPAAPRMCFAYQPTMHHWIAPPPTLGKYVVSGHVLNRDGEPHFPSEIGDSRLDGTLRPARPTIRRYGPRYGATSGPAGSWRAQSSGGATLGTSPAPYMASSNTRRPVLVVTGLRPSRTSPDQPKPALD